MTSVHASLEPNWIRSEQLRRSRVPDGLSAWLLDRGSLTARIRGTCRGPDFRVSLLRQIWKRPLYSESRLLGLRHGGIAMIREVELHCRGIPWVFARTLIPASSLNGPARRLAHLGDRPLGEVLFSDLRMRRGVMEVARLLPRHPLFMSASSNLDGVPDEIWGRRTLFFLSGKPLLVNEIFLPDIPGRKR